MKKVSLFLIDAVLSGFVFHIIVFLASTTFLDSFDPRLVLALSAALLCIASSVPYFYSLKSAKSAKEKVIYSIISFVGFALFFWICEYFNIAQKILNYNFLSRDEHFGGSGFMFAFYIVPPLIIAVVSRIIFFIGSVLRDRKRNKEDLR